MATLQNIRNRGGLLVSIVIGLALVAFIVGDALSSGASIFNRSKNSVGEIAGENISIQDYQKKVEKNENTIKATNNISALNDEQQNMLRENTWQQIVMDILMNDQYQQLGIDVTGEELYDVMLGDNMSPEIRQRFADPNTGEIDVERLRTFVKQLLEAPDNTPQKIYWLNLEEEVGTTRKLTKYNALLSKGLYITDAQATEAAQNNATKSDISFVMKSYSSISDSAVKVSDSEIKTYYNDHQKLFDQQESRKIAYVNFDIEASPEDYRETESWVKDLEKEFVKTEDAGEFVNLSSDKKFDKTYYSKGEIENEGLAEFIFSAASTDSVYGPYLEGSTYKIAKAASKKMLPDSVRARHILIRDNSPERTQAIADSLADVLKKGGDFETLAKQYSVDQNSAINGGDLGWFSAGTMIQPLSDSAFFAKKNEIKVVMTQAGAHVLQTTDLAKPVEKVQIAIVEKEIAPSQATTDKIYNNALTFANGLKTTQDLDKKTSESGITKRIATVNKNDRTISGMENAREFVRQIYLSETPGQVVMTTDGSEIFENGNKFTIAVLTEVSEEGIAPLNSVTDNIKRELIRKKKAELLKKELETALQGSGSLMSVAQKANAEVMEATDVTFNSFQLPGAGIEPKVIATASLLEQGKLSPVIDGNQGVYVIMVNNRETEDITPDMIEQAKMGMMQSNMYRANYQAMQALMKNGEIKDLRYKFY